MIDILIKNGTVFTMAGEGTGLLMNGAVAIDRDLILAVGNSDLLEKEFQAEQVIDADGRVVLPGFIDGHVHTMIALTRGVAQDSPAWWGSVDPYTSHIEVETLQAGAKLTLVEAIRAGTTTLVDSGFGITQVASIYEQSGVRAVLSGLISELQSSSRLDDPHEPAPFNTDLGEMWFQENLELVEKWQYAATGRITTMIGPQAPNLVSKEMLKKAREAAERFDVKLNVHLAQSDNEAIQTRTRYGQTPTEVLREAGYLGDRLLAAHMIYATEEDVREVARSGASMAFCPSSLLICDGMIPPADVFSDAGGAVCLGTDETSSNNGANIFSEMKLGSLCLKMKHRDPTVMPAWKLLRMATIEGARAIGLGDCIGSLEAGKKADIILVDLNRPSMLPVLTSPVRNIVPNLVLSARGDEVITSIINGEIVYQDRRIQTMDEPAVLAEAQEKGLEMSRKAVADVQSACTLPYQMTQAGQY